MTLVRLALNPSGGGDDDDGDVDDDGDGWKLDHSRLIGGVNNTVGVALQLLMLLL